MIQRAQRENTRVGISVVDIDLFQKVNDSLGNSYGDELLQMFAKRLQQTVRKEDTVCRLGGDEFAIIYPIVGSAEILAQMMKRLFGVLSEPFHLAGQALTLLSPLGLQFFQMTVIIPILSSRMLSRP